MKELKPIVLVEDNPHDAELALAAFEELKLTKDVLTLIIDECRREAAETEASIAPAHPRRAGTRPFRGFSHVKPVDFQELSTS